GIPSGAQSLSPLVGHRRKRGRAVGPTHSLVSTLEGRGNWPHRPRHQGAALKSYGNPQGVEDNLQRASEGLRLDPSSELRFWRPDSSRGDAWRGADGPDARSPVSR